MTIEQEREKRTNRELLESVALQPLMDELAAELNGAFIISNHQKKEVVLTLKIKVDITNREVIQNGIVVKRWDEPSLEHAMTRTITETKVSKKGNLPYDEYSLEFEDGHPVIGKRYKQLKLGE